MEQAGTTRNGPGVLVSLAAFVIVVAGMRAASTLIVPFLLSAFIAIICAPLLSWMRKRGVPTGVSVLIVLIGMIIVGLLLTTVLRSSLSDFIAAAPKYQARLSEKYAALKSWLDTQGLDLLEGDNDYLANFNPSKLMGMAVKAMAGLGGVLKNFLLITLTVVFILLEASGFGTKVRMALSDPAPTLAKFDSFSQSLNRYLAVKTIISLATGLLVWILLAILRIDFAFLWGLLAFAFNYVPSIGSFIAAIPAVLLAIVQYGLARALFVVLGYAVINVGFGSILEPRVMGRSLGLSTLVVFLSLLLWGWVLGPVGMVLSVPLTVVLKFALESSESTHWLAVMLGPAHKDKSQ